MPTPAKKTRVVLQKASMAFSYSASSMMSSVSLSVFFEYSNNLCHHRGGRILG
jgi:hypothetical protein